MNEALAKAALISSRMSQRFKAKGHIAALRAGLVRYVPNAKMPRTAFLASLQQDVVIDACEKMQQVRNDTFSVITRLGVADCSVASVE